MRPRDGAQAVELVRALRPDVVLMDIRMPGWTGSRRPGASCDAAVRRRVLVLTTFDLDEYVFEALRAGASGFLLKDAPADELAGRDPGGRRRGRVARAGGDAAADRRVRAPPAAPRRARSTGGWRR